MTGGEIQWIRQQLGNLSVAQFSELIGASESSVYRWEATNSPAIDPFQLRILTLARQQLTLPKAKRAALIRSVSKGVLNGGGLRGLYHLLDSVFGGGAK